MAWHDEREDLTPKQVQSVERALVVLSSVLAWVGMIVALLGLPFFLDPLSGPWFVAIALLVAMSSIGSHLVKLLGHWWLLGDRKPLERLVSPREWDFGGLRAIPGPALVVGGILIALAFDQLLLGGLLFCVGLGIRLFPHRSGWRRALVMGGLGVGAMALLYGVMTLTSSVLSPMQPTSLATPTDLFLFFSWAMVSFMPSMVVMGILFIGTTLAPMVLATRAMGLGDFERARWWTPFIIGPARGHTAVVIELEAGEPQAARRILDEEDSDESSTEDFVLFEEGHVQRAWENRASSLRATAAGEDTAELDSEVLVWGILAGEAPDVLLDLSDGVTLHPILDRIFGLDGTARLAAVRAWLLALDGQEAEARRALDSAVTTYALPGVRAELAYSRAGALRVLGDEAWRAEATAAAELPGRFGRMCAALLERPTEARQGDERG